MYIYGNQWTIGEGQEDPDKANELLIWKFNVDRTKNREVTRVASLEIEINRHKEQLEAAVTDWNGTDMFLGHDWLVKHNPEVN